MCPLSQSGGKLELFSKLCQEGLSKIFNLLQRYCMFMWLPMYLVHYLQYSVAQAGLFSTIFDVGGSFGSPLLGLILDRKFKKNTLLGMWICVTLSSISMALFAMTARLGLLHNALFMLIAGATNGGADSLLGTNIVIQIMLNN
jgi:sugar phosphate permease